MKNLINSNRFKDIFELKKKKDRNKNKNTG